MVLQKVESPIALIFLVQILGSYDVNNSKTKTLVAVKAIHNNTLQITLKQPTAYFLQIMADSIAFPLNQTVINQFGQTDWVNHAAGNGTGTGPVMVKEGDHNTKMVFVPNPHWYAAKTKLTEVDMLFVNDQSTAFKAYQAGQYIFVWTIALHDKV